MKVFVAIELDVETPIEVKGVPSTTVESLLNQLRIHTNWVVKTFDGTVVKFTVEKA